MSLLLGSASVVMLAKCPFISKWGRMTHGFYLVSGKHGGEPRLLAYGAREADLSYLLDRPREYFLRRDIVNGLAILPAKTFNVIRETWISAHRRYL